MSLLNTAWQPIAIIYSYSLPTIPISSLSSPWPAELRRQAKFGRRHEKTSVRSPLWVRNDLVNLMLHTAVKYRLKSSGRYNGAPFTAEDRPNQRPYRPCWPSWTTPCPAFSRVSGLLAMFVRGNARWLVCKTALVIYAFQSEKCQCAVSICVSCWYEKSDTRKLWWPCISHLLITESAKIYEMEISQ